ncbi:MAG: N-acetylneuraminate synthase family protein [Phycisphaerales bacterium]|nr:N-acetylneuraminate synthase family protein [Phycisphaerales bacterium]
MIIAELGVNHDGSVDRARALMRLAHGCGVDAVKFQCFEADALMGAAACLAAYQAATETDPLEMLRRLQLPLGAFGPLVDEAHALGMKALVTIFSLDHIDAMGALAWDGFKTASPDLVHRPLLEAVASLGRPMLVSTGASTRDEIERALSWLDGADVRTLHCVSAYPTAPADTHLLAMRDVPRCCGYSDHTTGIEVASIAKRLGATVLEKHFTDDVTRAGPDHRASLDPEGMRAYVRAFHEARAGDLVDECEVLGDGVKRVLACERDVREVSRQSLTASRDLEVGTTLTRADLVMRRPGVGIEPFHLDEVVGRVVARAVGAGHPLTWEDVG